MSDDEGSGSPMKPSWFCVMLLVGALTVAALIVHW
jgi:hypothetical protein